MSRILVVVHNHPEFHPGGSEIFARDLFLAYKRAGHEALFLAATNRIHREARPGTSFQAIGPSGDEIVLWAGQFDRFYMSQVDTHGVFQDLAVLLKDFCPDTVHIHHLLLIGAEFPVLVRRLLPKARIVFTLHDYYPICPHDGLMVRPQSRERCDRASPSRCHGCFPEIPMDRHLLRERHLKTLLRPVDCFVAPSNFLRQRYVQWGLPANKIEVIRNARPRTVAAPARPGSDERADIFGYFGNLNPWKGINVLLKSARQLREQGVRFELRLHGAPPFQSESFVSEVELACAAVGSNLVRLGAYEVEQIPSLMAAVDWVVVPSTWWENAPLVIQEAFQHRRPVIASGIGGMAEAVKDGVTGLLALPDDPSDLARVMRRAAEEAGLHRKLAESIREEPDIDACAAQYLALFADRASRAAVA